MCITEKNENTVYRIDLATNEETFFCDIDGPCYISADSNYVYFDNLQSIYAGTDADNRKIFVYDKSGKCITYIVPQSPKDECYFGGDDYMFFKDMGSNSKVYSFDKSLLTSTDRQFIDM